MSSHDQADRVGHRDPQDDHPERGETGGNQAMNPVWASAAGALNRYGPGATPWAANTIAFGDDSDTAMMPDIATSTEGGLQLHRG
jgi:hypothetical protein